MSTDVLLSVVFTFFAVAGVTVAATFVIARLWPSVPADRLRAPAPTAVSDSSILRWEDRARVGWERLLERLGGLLGARDSGRVSRYRARLHWAGFADPRAVRYFIGAKVACAILLGYSYTLYGLATQRLLGNLLLVSAILAVIGLMLPDLWLSRRVKRRQRLILNALPDVLDLLMVCVEAGMAFDAAVARVATEGDPGRSPLHAELMRMHLEVRAGRPRSEALRAFAERIGVLEVKTMVATFIQADRLGTPLGKTLRVHSESARVQRRHRAEARAQVAPLKMLFPTVAFLLPCFFLVTLGPSILTVVKLLRTIGR